MKTNQPKTESLLQALEVLAANVRPAIKSADNPFFKKKYADLKEIHHAVKEALQLADLVVSQTTMVSEGAVILRTELIHVATGQKMVSEYPVSFKDINPQSIGSGLTYARRYQLACICGVITDDDDAEAAEGRKSEVPVKKTESKKAETIKAMKNAKTITELQKIVAGCPEDWKNQEFDIFVKSLESKLVAAEIKDQFGAEEIKKEGANS